MDATGRANGRMIDYVAFCIWAERQTKNATNDEAHWATVYERIQMFTNEVPIGEQQEAIQEANFLIDNGRADAFMKRRAEAKK